MSLNNFGGEGFADQPSIIYSFGGSGDEEIREMVRSTMAGLGKVVRGGNHQRIGDITVAEVSEMTGVTA
ncbi:hypothetical protein [Halorubrum yunnanense]|uniref:Uncharacterized protein n=1 Tax=Halorubrum yunnanense TaxID=1526162 RepID=A0ABD5YGK3_9EURY|nr:hypothetical protein [Halorubrum yunnanense]